MPNFHAQTTKGPINFHAFKKDYYSILFSHPDDFTPVCTTELGAVAKLSNKFKERNVKVIGLSCNSLESHEQWIRDINISQGTLVDFPIIADADRAVATAFDMLDHLDPTNVDKKGMPFTVRSVYFVDKQDIIRAIITYPASTGRNFDEILRVVDSLQVVDARSVATGQGWLPGDPLIVPSNLTDVEAQAKFPGFTTVLPYLRYTK